ncbi:glycosyltransferase [Priestia megaterium]|uniref:glycosyltransferase n=2 Tax=Priestia megaterium TaxID=1404 RepID=UPI000BF78153|nr:glycosyltransferase [Priestia megaterium]PFJ95641.1 glycosyltransferase [Priestia megaterium]PMD10793.1 glycosyltransferase [Priestia megaterium]
MKRLLMVGFMLLFSLNMLVEPSSARAETQEHRVSQSQVKFENEFRRLWMDHVLWTSNYITSATTAGSEDQKQVLTRLLKNQEDIGNAVKPIYGEKAGNRLTDLLKEHIVIAGKIVDAAKAGKKVLVNQLNKEWYRNADDIAAFLSQANPYLKNEDLKKLLYMHLKLVTNDLSASLEKDWEARIVAIDEGVSHIILMADTISAGVVKQFPKKFNE